MMIIFLSGRCLEITLKVRGVFKVKKGAFRKNKSKRTQLTIRLASAYTSGNVQEQLIFQEYLSDKFKLSKHELLLGQDSNAQIGVIDEV